MCNCNCDNEVTVVYEKTDVNANNYEVFAYTPGAKVPFRKAHLGSNYSSQDEVVQTLSNRFKDTMYFFVDEVGQEVLV